MLRLRQHRHRCPRHSQIPGGTGIPGIYGQMIIGALYQMKRVLHLQGGFRAEAEYSVDFGWIGSPSRPALVLQVPVKARDDVSAIMLSSIGEIRALEMINLGLEQDLTCAQSKNRA